MTPSPFLRRWLGLAVLAVGLFLVTAAQAQLVVDLQLKRRLYMLNEPVLATVTIVNQTGREVMLADTHEGGQWFSFQITTAEGRIIPPRNQNYELPPLQMKAGESIKRTVNLNELYTLGDFGAYQVQASIFFPAVGKYFGSKQRPMELTEGRVIWKETVGAPEEEAGGDQYRTYTLLTMEQDGHKNLYVRLQGQGEGTIFGCYNLGRMITGVMPDAKLDSGNNLAILHLVAPKTFLLSRVAVDGTFQGQSTYVTPKSQPYLRKTAGGALQIVGAIRQEPTVAATEPENRPKLSDRPSGF